MNNSYDGETRDPEAPEMSEADLAGLLRDPHAFVAYSNDQHWEQEYFGPFVITYALNNGVLRFDVVRTCAGMGTDTDGSPLIPRGGNRTGHDRVERADRYVTGSVGAHGPVKAQLAPDEDGRGRGGMMYFEHEQAFEDLSQVLARCRERGMQILRYWSLY